MESCHCLKNPSTAWQWTSRIPGVFFSIPDFRGMMRPIPAGNGNKRSSQYLASQRHVQLFRAPTMMSNRVTHVHYLAGPSTAMRMTDTALQRQCKCVTDQCCQTAPGVGLLCTKLCDRHDWLNRVYRPTKHIIGHLDSRGRVFMGQMTQPAVSKHWKK